MRAQVRTPGVIAGAFVMLGLIAAARPAAADGPGLGNFSYAGQTTPRTRLFPTSDIFKVSCAPNPDLDACDPDKDEGPRRGQSVVFMHRGYLFMVISRDSGKHGGGLMVWNMSNPSNPVNMNVDMDPARAGVQNCTCTTASLREVHAYAIWRNDASPGKEEYVALQSSKGVQIWDITNPLAPDMKKEVVLTGIRARDYDYGAWWVSWQAPYIYVGGSENGLYVIDATNPLTAAAVTAPGVSTDFPNGCDPLDGLSNNNPLPGQSCPPISKDDLGQIRVNQALAIGNLMMLAHADSTGLCTADLSQNPRRPTRIDSIRTSSDVTRQAPNTYTYGVAGQAAYPGKLYAYAVGLQVVDITDGIISVHPVKDMTADKIGYFNFQDGFLFGGYSEDGWSKFDVSNHGPRPGNEGRDPDHQQITEVMTGHTNVVGADEDFATVLGNLVFLGNDHNKPDSETGSALYVHTTVDSKGNAPPDTTGPAVNYISPPNGRTNLPTTARVGIIFTDNIDLRSVSPSTFIVRRQSDGALIPGKFTFSLNYVNFVPNAPLTNNTVYEVVIPAGGITDWVGNPTASSFTSSFTVGNPPALVGPTDCKLTSNQSAVVYVPATVSFTASCTGGTPPYTYSFDFDDDSAPTPFTSASQASHDFSTAKHFNVKVTVKNAAGQSSASHTQTIVNRPTWDDAVAKEPTRSTPIAYDDNGTRGNLADDRLHVVNPDANRVASFLASSMEQSPLPAGARWEAYVGKNPRTLAVRPGSNELWVACQDEGSIRVLDKNTGTAVGGGIILLPPGSRPYGVVFDPQGLAAYVSLEGTGRLAKIDPTSKTVLAELDVGPRPRGLAVTADGLRLFVTRFVSGISYPPGALPAGNGELREVRTSDFQLANLVPIAADTTSLDSESSGRGIPNFVQAVTVSPDGRYLLVPAKKDNVFRGMASDGTRFVRDGRPLTFDATVRTIVSVFDIYTSAVPFELLNHRRDVNNADMSNATVLSRYGEWVFVANHNNQVAIYDGFDYEAQGVVDFDMANGKTPQGLAISPDDKRLYVFCFMSRSIEIYDVQNVGKTTLFPKTASVSVQADPLPTDAVFRGKQIFYNSADPRMSKDSYLACATCHLEGGSDDIVFDFTDGDEGLRNTITLLGRRGTGHGPVHWSANFDEIQDFEHPIRKLFAGGGFMLDADFNFGTRNTPLGLPKANVNPANTAIDDLAAYVTSLSTVPRSPFRDPQGQLTAAGERGRVLFHSTVLSTGKTCATCHAGRDFTDSAAGGLHDVGTIKATSGKRLGGPLTGIDTPTMLGVWNTAPYLHDGSKATLADVLEDPLHVGTSLSAAQKADLVAYLQQVDDIGRDVIVSNLTVVDGNGPRTSLQGGLSAGDLAFGDRAHVWASVPTLLEGALWIRTADDSRNAVDPGALLSFDVNRPTDVYVGVDRRLNGKLPSWLQSGWKLQTGATLSLRELDAPAPVTWDVYKKTTAVSGTATLASLEACGGDCSAFHMYSAFLKPAGAAPAAPTGVAAVGAHQQITVSWGAVAGADSYNLKASLTPGGPYDRVITGIPGTGQVDPGLSNGTTYYYVVSAVSSAGEGPDSLEVSAIPSCPTLAIPAGLTATPQIGKINLSWNAVSGATGYVVKRTPAGASGPVIGNPAGNALVDPNVNAGTSYVYTVAASSGCAVSSDSPPVSAAPLANGKSALLVVNDANATTAGLQLTPGDALIQSHLQGLGFTVAAVEDVVSTSADATGKQLVFISRSVGSTDVGTKFDTTTVPVIVSEGQLFIEMRMSTTETTNTVTGQTSLVISNASSPLSAGLTGTQVVTSAATTISVGTALASADKAVTVVGNTALAAIFGYAAGATLATGTAPARRVGFFLNDPGNGTASTTDVLNTTGWNLFNASVNWAAGSAPPAPTLGSATAGNAQVSLSWTASAGASSYNVKRSTSTGTGYATVGTTAGTTLVDQSGLSNGTTYFYVVTAVNPLGESGNSNERSAKPVAPPPAPTGLSAAPGNAKVTLGWDPTPGATSYNVKRSTISGTGYVTVGTSPTPGLTDTNGLSNGTTYYYVVTAVNAGGESGNSGQAQAKPVAPPPAPTTLNATAGDAQVALSWSASAGATSYNVKRSTTTGTGYVTVGIAAGTTLTDENGLSNGTTYFYVVTAVNEGGESGNSPEKSAKPVGRPPAPLGLTAAPADSKVNLSWTAVSGADSYNIKISTTSGSGYTQTGTSTTPSFLVPNLTNGTTYFFVVSAVNVAGEGPDSAEASAKPVAPPPPPAGLTATAGTGQVTLTWTASAGATSYDIRRSTTSGSGYASVGTSPTTSFTNNTSVTNGTKYFYVVAAVNAGGPGGNSGEASATPMAAPTGVSATAKNASVDVAWSPVTGATSYKVKVSTTSGSGYTQAGTPAASPFNVPGLTNGTTYFFVVTAVNSSGESVSSVEVSAKPSAFLYQYIQAESVTPAASTFSVVSDATASGGQYIWRAGTTGRTALPSPVPTTGDVNYTVTVPAAGTYRLWGRCMAAGTGNDSIFVKIDGTGVTMKNDDGTTTGITSGWAVWNDLGAAAPLGVGVNVWGWMRQRNNDDADAFVQFTTTGAGTVNVRLLYREPQMKIDRLLVTNDLTFTPSGTGP